MPVNSFRFILQRTMLVLITCVSLNEEEIRIFLYISRNSNRQCDVTCELKLWILSQGGTRRAEGTEMWKGWEENTG